jgi:gas vesicle protein
MARHKKTQAKFADTVPHDLSTLKDTVEALDEVLHQNDEDFDPGEAEEYCDQIEELAKAIRDGLNHNK